MRQIPASVVRPRARKRYGTISTTCDSTRDVQERMAESDVLAAAARKRARCVLAAQPSAAVAVAPMPTRAALGGPDRTASTPPVALPAMRPSAQAPTAAEARAV